MTTYGNSTMQFSSDGLLASFTATDDYSGDYTDIPNSTEGLKEICEASSKQEVTAVVVQVALFFVVFFLGVTGNGLVIATFARYRRLRLRSMTDVFLFHLALADLMLLLTLPLRTGEALASGWLYGDELCKLNHGMHAINTYSGLLLLACISADRYLVVVRGRAVQRLRPDMLSYGGLCSVFVVIASVLLSLPELFFASVIQEASDPTQRCGMKVWTSGDSGWAKKWAQVAKIVGFCVPGVAMLVFYGAIGHVLLQGGAKCWRKQRTLRLMLALVLLFLLFQLPYTMVLSFRMSIDFASCEGWARVHLSEDVTLSLAYVRCCLNPLLYALVAVRFRTDVMRLLQEGHCMCACLKQLAPNAEAGSSVTPSSTAPTTLTAVPAVPSTKRPATSNMLLIPQDNGKELCVSNSLSAVPHPYKELTALVEWGQR